MKLYKAQNGIYLFHENDLYPLSQSWDELINWPNLYDHLTRVVQNEIKTDLTIEQLTLMPPIHSQEIWASGVTYYSSREARIEESKDVGGGDFYDRVYYADRPELFFKSTAARAVGHGGAVRIRKDSSWNVPEPELTLVINSSGQIIGYTIGNDMSSRDIEGENPLYLPQAKTYDGSAAIGPCVWVAQEPISPDANISIEINRNNEVIFSGVTQINQIKRELPQLVDYLFAELTFPNGAYLMTGTGVVPPNEFTLQIDDKIKISIDHIGVLENTVEQ